MSDTVDVTSVSRGADAIPCTTLMIANDPKDYVLLTEPKPDRNCLLTLEKNPQIFVASRNTVEMTKNGRFPQMLAPAAVKNVVNPIQNARKPISKLLTMSRLTLYFSATTFRPGVTIGPRLNICQSL
jgi:hypothetical protein